MRQATTTGRLAQVETNSKPVLVYSTFPDEVTARTIARDLVAGGLVACVNVLGAMTSIYNWTGELHEDAEVAALLKTTTARADEVIAFVKSRHPYDNPALLVLPVAGGSAEFLAWIAAETGAAKQS
jgi:periplasmic divalent cation tolerance protein